MGVEFRVITLKPLNVGNIGRVDAGVDVTEQLGKFVHLASLVDMGDVTLVPVGEAPAASQSDEQSVAPPPADLPDESPAAVTVGSEEPSVADGGDVEYMDDPSGFTISEVVAYAEAHPEHAQMLLELEAEGKNRSKIIKALTALVG